ncbi:hypothetical protein [Pseudobacteriovorax antillogorgiicola]|uniref:Uncharacterized protein n=1 Tax=Pseudobacteriovorax antillogorgiicola TaxID=1513793 RepID=A0A1Y6C0C5_9BACT|nr:hypothetical protein [Pseudobacteriovorax antillogorgiicola]TCS43365.1 hypothetical protein EDD56_1375 [Pseudobacteriovorax antillogorgiicola]SMF35121.1 hypothetical protein SAMN06296036_110203 [Pseudobacteriovorax antillogorgiicola]
MTEVIQVKSKEISVEGKQFFVGLVSMGEDEGLLVSQAADLFGVRQNTIWTHVQKRGLSYSVIPRESLLWLKKQGFIGPRAPKACFLPKETLRALVKLINSNVAWDIFNRLWEVTDRAYEFHTKSDTISEIDAMMRSLSILKEQQQKIDRLETETPKLIDRKIETALEDKQAFPSDCMRISEILSNYFPGIAEKKVVAFLKNSCHPRGNHVHIDENGIKTVSHPFKAEGLQELSKAFFEERKLIRETAKCRFYFHPMAGNMREYI